MKLFSVPLRVALFAGLVATGLNVAPVFAQSTPSTEDLRALRFYIEQNETAAIQAEVRRLGIEFPGWTPPEDLTQLLKTAPTTEVADIYSRLSRGDTAGARKLLEQTQARYPSWDVPADLTAQISLSDAQSTFDRAIAARDITTAIDTVSKNPSLLRCDRINNTWSLANLQSTAGNRAGAYVAYRQIVNTCNKIPDLVATIEKSEAVTTDAELTSLVDTAKARFVTQSATFDALENRLLAGRGVQPAATVAKPQTREAARTDTAAKPAPATTPRVVAATPAPGMAGRPQTRGVTVQLPRSGDPRLGRTRAAARVGNYPDCLAQSVAPRSVDVAYERAWCAYNMERPLEALAYFNMAASGALGADVARDARFGMMLSLLKRNMTEEASRYAASTDLTPEQRKEIESSILSQRGVRAYQEKHYARAAEYFNGLEVLDGTLTRDIAMLRGYAYLNMGDRESARIEFERLHNALATEETRAAIAATY